MSVDQAIEVGEIQKAESVKSDGKSRLSFPRFGKPWGKPPETSLSPNDKFFYDMGIKLFSSQKEISFSRTAAKTQIAALTREFLANNTAFQRFFQQEKIPVNATRVLWQFLQANSNYPSYYYDPPSGGIIPDSKENFDRLKEFSLPFIHSNLIALEATAISNKAVNRGYPEMSLVSYLAKFGVGNQKKDAVEFLLRNLERVSDEFKKPDEPHHDLIPSLVLAAIVENSDPEQFGKFTKLIGQIVTRDMIRNILRTFPDDMYEEKIKEIVSKFNLDPEITLTSWKASIGGREDAAIELNIATVIKLEQERPGISSALSRDFGIYNFGRYPKEMLIAQYDAREKTDLPYGTVIYPYSDHSTAFYNDGKVFQQLFDQVKDRYAVRIFEVKSPLEMVSALNASRKKFGKISFAIIGGHGSPHSVAFGGRFETRRKLSQNQVAKKGASALSLAFVDNPSIVMSSCSTGQLGGIGEEISKLGARVVGPEESANLENITVKLSAGRIQLDATYVDPDSILLGKRIPIKANTFPLGT